MATDHELIGEHDEEPVVVVDYDGEWPERFQEWHHRLTGAVSAAVRIDHVGSTAVKGLAAKPTIDVQISVPDVEDEPAYVHGVESTGVTLRLREPGRRLFRPPVGEPRTVHIHVCDSGGQWESDHLLFRDYLIENPDRRAEYELLKRSLAIEHRHDRIAYTHAKTSFVTETLQLARRR